ncbi:MAG TPA: undecaprenyl-phosphate glucose phosphotransferase [Nevskiaceae bacterium]|nr:undecaprenyl-phosphate glucose phosphotransferase [Nevskiaceae bacterium]
MNRSNQGTATLVQGVIYASVVTGNLMVLAHFHGVGQSLPYQVLAMLSAALSYLVLRRFDLTIPWNPGRPGSIGNAIFWSWLGLVGTFLFLAYLTKFSEYFSRRVLILWFLSTPVLLWLIHALVMLFLRRFLPTVSARRSAVVVFANETARQLARNLARSENYRLVGFFDDRDVDRIGGPMEDTPYLGKARNVAQYVRDHDIEVVFVVLPDDGGKRAAVVMDELGDTTASVYYVPDFLIFNLLEATVQEIEGIPVLQVSETPFYGADGILKQLFDFAFSLGVLIALSPLLLLVAAAVKLTSPGPVFFKQKRYGLGGQRFWVYKFRSMYVGDDAQRQQQQATKDDPRVTPVGRFIRRTSIDELPQFLNVLKGDMSVVGPRPHSVAHNEQYRKEVKRYMARHKVKPGLTGWAQVNGLRGETANLERMEERIRYDLEYIRNWSPMLDIKIIFMTVLMIFRDENAY